MTRLRIVADENMPAVEEFFSDIGDITRVVGRDLNAKQLVDTDVLLVRSVTQVDANLLGSSKIKFVGTATIGTDHLDIDYLEKHNIAWSSAPGCNAVSVAEYVLSVLCHFSEKSLASLHGRRAGVIGYGNVGKQVVQRLQMLGMQVVVYDPLLDPSSAPLLTSLNEVVDVDVLCVHAPLTRLGSYPSFHMLQEAELTQMRQGAYLISAGRGGVVANSAITALRQQRPDILMAFDVWENEPAIDWLQMITVEFATPHIAGYSYDGKVTGTRMLRAALQTQLGLTPFVDTEAETTLIDIDVERVSVEHQLSKALLDVYDVMVDDERFRALLSKPEHERAAGFDLLRKHYPQRRECSSYRVLNLDSRWHAIAGQLGFKLGC